MLLFWESFLGNFLFSICMLFGVSMTSALAAGVTMAALPGVVAVLSWLFLRERIAPRVLMGIACAVGGIALVSLSKHHRAGHGQRQASRRCSATCCWSAPCCARPRYVVIGKQLTGQVSAKRISALVNLWGLVLVTPFGLWQALSFDFSAVAPGHWTLLVFYALAASMVTVWLWMTGLKHVPASQAGVFTVLLPVSAALVGVVFLGERFSPVQAAGLWPGAGRRGAGHLAGAPGQRRGPGTDHPASITSLRCSACSRAALASSLTRCGRLGLQPVV